MNGLPHSKSTIQRELIQTKHNSDLFWPWWWSSGQHAHFYSDDLSLNLAEAYNFCKRTFENIGNK